MRYSLSDVGAYGVYTSACALISTTARVYYTYGDSDVISMPAGCRRHLVGKTLIYVFHCDSAEIRFVGKI